MSKQNGIENDENQINIFDILYPERKKPREGCKGEEENEKGVRE